MKVLVTGGAGFIGSHTVVALVKAGYTPIIIDNFENSDNSVLDGLAEILGAQPLCYEGDCRDGELLSMIFEAHPDLQGVIHFAANKAVGESVKDPLKYYDNNLGSTITLLKAMVHYGVPNLAFSSSCTVYGQPEVLPVTENSPVQPAQSPYGNTKQICEEILQDAVRSGLNLRVLSLRYFNPIGAHESAIIGELPIGPPQNLVPFITQTAVGLREQLSIFGHDYNTSDGTCIRDYIHVVDLADAHVAAIKVLEAKQDVDQYYDFVNIGTGTGSTVLQVVNTFEAVSGVKVNYQLVDRRPGDVEQVYAQVDKATNLLGWKTKLTLEDALRDAWRWEQRLAENRADEADEEEDGFMD
jgi:UDP-glucose 4-epimerase